MGPNSSVNFDFARVHIAVHVRVHVPDNVRVHVWVSDLCPDHFRILGQIQTKVHTLRKILINIEMDFKVLMKFPSKLLILKIIEKI